MKINKNPESVVSREAAFELINKDLPTWQHRTERGKHMYLLLDVGDSAMAVGYNYFKKEFFPIKPLTLDKENPWRIYTLNGEEKLADKSKADHDIIPVPLAELFGRGNITGPNVFYMLVKRTESRIPDKLRMSLALIVEKPPRIAYYDNLNIPNNPVLGSMYPAFVTEKDSEGNNIPIPVVDLGNMLKSLTDVFCAKYPQLAQHYPYSDNFKYKEQQDPIF